MRFPGTGFVVPKGWFVAIIARIIEGPCRTHTLPTRGCKRGCAARQEPICIGQGRPPLAWQGLCHARGLRIPCAHRSVRKKGPQCWPRTDGSYAEEMRKSTEEPIIMWPHTCAQALLGECVHVGGSTSSPKCDGRDIGNRCYIQHWAGYVRSLRHNGQRNDMCTENRRL